MTAHIVFLNVFEIQMISCVEKNGTEDGDAFYGKYLTHTVGRICGRGRLWTRNVTKGNYSALEP